MPDYDFTVRATDNLGAYSDRTFTITVKNTNVERYLLVGDAGLAHSSTGLPGSWVTESALSGTGGTYGNGVWVVFGNKTIRTSVDTINWSSSTINLPNPTNVGGSLVLNEIHSIKYKKGAWYLFAGYQSGSNYTSIEFTSLDLINWTSTGRYTMNLNTLRWAVYDFDYNPDTDRWIAAATIGTYSYILTRTGNAAWSIAYTATNFLNRNTAVAVMNINGLWIVNTGSATNVGPVVSSDGLNWTPKPITSGSFWYPYGMAYSNGRLIQNLRAQANSNQVVPQYLSVNGGRTWVEAGSYTQTQATITATQTLAAYGNVVLGLTGISGQYGLSTNGGVNWSNESHSSGIGNVLAVIARQD